jgi:hypothetical protein
VAESTPSKKYNANYVVLSTFLESSSKTIYLKPSSWPKDADEKKILIWEPKVNTKRISKASTSKFRLFTALPPSTPVICQLGLSLKPAKKKCIPSGITFLRSANTRSTQENQKESSAKLGITSGTRPKFTVSVLS